MVAGYIACNARSTGSQFINLSNRSRKSLAGTYGIMLSRRPSCWVGLVCMPLGRFIHVPGLVGLHRSHMENLHFF